MLERIRYLIRVFWRRWTKRDYPSTEIAFITDDDNYEYPITPDPDCIHPDFGFNEDFRDCRTQDEYNRDFVSIFKHHRRNVLLDRSHKDGHFRV